VANDHAAALCRDAAVRWLERPREWGGCKYPWGGCIIGFGGDTRAIRDSDNVGWTIAEHEGSGVFRFLGWGVDKDAALFAACKAVIEARKA